MDIETPAGRATFEDVVVKVPTDRLAEFYEWFGRWLGDLEPPQRSARAVPSAGPWKPAEDLDVATEAWRRFPARSRQLLSTLIDNPDRRYWGQRLAELHDIPNGLAGVAGTLAWPGRILRALGRPLPIETTPDPRGGSTYWMTPALARLFDQARQSAVEPTGPVEP